MEWRSEADAVFCSNTLWEIGGEEKKKGTRQILLRRKICKGCRVFSRRGWKVCNSVAAVNDYEKFTLMMKIQSPSLEKSDEVSQ